MVHELDTNLVRVNIRRKDYRRIKMERIGNEPFYSTMRRIIDTLDTEKVELTSLLADMTNQCRSWKDRYWELKARNQPMDRYLDIPQEGVTK